MLFISQCFSLTPLKPVLNTATSDYTDSTFVDIAKFALFSFFLIFASNIEIGMPVLRLLTLE